MKKISNQNHKIKIKITLYLPVKLIERMRNVVYWTPTFTLASLAASSIESTLKKLERGKRIRSRKGKIRTGRPPKRLAPH